MLNGPFRPKSLQSCSMGEEEEEIEQEETKNPEIIRHKKKFSFLPSLQWEEEKNSISSN